MSLRVSSESHALLPGLPVFEERFAERFSAGGTPVAFEPGRETPGFSMVREEGGFRVRYALPCDAYRALGSLLAGEEALSQNRAHQSVGVMWDASRNGVPLPEAWEELFRKFALLGVNEVQLYMEDVYPLRDEPYFGYGRGAYSPEELRRIDAYGRRLGIEVIPCIQTLGHLEQILQWPAYSPLSDVPGVLMVGEEETRRLIGKMLDAVVENFQTRRIHIGMDEAHGVGTGNYLKKHGWERPFDLLTRHLNEVVAMCRERGLRPMMWSDLFFRLGSKHNGYFDWDAVIPPETASRIPPDVDLVYWDYCHVDPAFYEEWIRRHRALGKEPVYAGGACSWGRFWAYAPRWRRTLAAGMKAAREEKLSRTVLTIWGDDGTEFHPASVFPAVQYFTEWAYAGDPDEETLERRFASLFPGSPLPAYLHASELDEIPAVRGVLEPRQPAVATQVNMVNYSKWILWHDPVLGFLNAPITEDLPGHYRKLADALDRPEADGPIRFAVRVARAVAAKAELHVKARAAWKAGDGEELRRLRETVLPESLRALRELRETHQAVWREWNKPFGWEVIERRYAGTASRLETLGGILDECLKNPAARVPEWEFEPLGIRDRPSGAYFSYHQVTTPSHIK